MRSYPTVPIQNQQQNTHLPLVLVVICCRWSPSKLCSGARISITTRSTACMECSAVFDVWLWGYDSEPKFCSRCEEIVVIRDSVIFLHKNMLLLLPLLLIRTVKVHMYGDPLLFLSPLRINLCVPYKRCKLWSPKWYFTGLCWQREFCQFSPFESRKSLESVCSPHDIVACSCSENFVCLWCSFFEFEAKLWTQALWHQLS